MSTSTLGGHVDTIPNEFPARRRRRRRHSAEFKANAVASCLQPGMSMAAVAMAHGINANLLRRWVHEAELRPAVDAPNALPAPKSATVAARPSFVPMALPAQSASADIRIDLRHGATSITVSWPSGAAAECAAWMRELLR